MTSDTSPHSVVSHDGERHGWLDDTCDNLAAVICGRHAEQWLAGVHGPLPRWGAVVTVPLWRWAKPGIDVGRKSRSTADDGTLLLPIRVQWEPHQVSVVETNTTETLTWSAAGMGHTGSGTVEVSVSAGHSGTGVISDHLPRAARVRSRPQAELISELQDLADRGRNAWWSTLESIKPMAHKAVNRAAAFVSSDIHGIDDDDEYGPHLLDRQTIDLVAEEMVMGSTVGADPSPMERLIELCLDPSKFARVDPLRYIRTAIERDAEHAVRGRLDDPRIGSMVRATYREERPETLDELLDAHRARHPNHRLGKGRAARALLVSGNPIAGSAPLEDYHEPALSEDFADAVVAELDKERASARSLLIEAARTAGIPMPPSRVQTILSRAGRMMVDEHAAQAIVARLASSALDQVDATEAA